MFQTQDLWRAVLAAVVADPPVSSHIGVTAQAGDVTLTGHVSSCGQRDAACRAARWLGGVKDLINSVPIAAPSDLEAAQSSR